VALIVVDTTVWVSALLNPSGAPARLLQAWLEGRLEVATSPDLPDELVDVLSQPRIRDGYRLTAVEVTRFVALMAEGARVVETTGQSYGCRDVDDDVVIETAVVAGVGLVVTRDTDLKGDAELAAWRTSASMS
jgi:hypothetical protein